MLPRARRIRTAPVFGAIRRDGRTSSTNILSVGARLRAEDTQSAACFGFVVSRRVGNATVRNQVKRRLRAVAQASGTAFSGWDIVITARPAAAHATFADISNAMLTAINRATYQARTTPSVDVR